MPDGYKAVGTKGFEALTVESLRELKAENEALKHQIAGLTSRLAALETTGVGATSGRDRQAAAAGGK